MTPEQLATLAADIAADPVLSAIPHTADGAWEIAAAYNVTASPDYWVWRTDIGTPECKTAMVWTEFIARSTGERDAWQFMLSDGYINAADINVRQGIADIFSGPGGAASRTNLMNIARRAATRAEQLCASGEGTIVSPATMMFEGVVTYQDVLASWAI